jgi:hypothetical protein
MSKDASPAFVERCSGDAATLARRTQHWANAVFAYLHTHKQNMQLTALVVCCYVSGDMYYYLPQNCFVRGYETDALSRKTAIAVPVSRAVLRASEPYADILDWNPGCNFFGHYPGRFNSN